MEISNQSEWNKWIESNKDDYGSACIRYAENWANIMEQSLKKGMTIEQCAEETSHQADTEGITGYMHGAAVSMLVQCWKHGELLRQWHNKSYGKDVEKANQSGGVINPAIITINV